MSLAQADLEWIAMIEGPAGRVRDQDIYPRLRSWLEQASPSDVLDIGCGQGICSEKIGLNLCRYTGIDPSPVLIARAREIHSAGNRRFMNGDAYALPLQSGTFDAAFSVTVWHLLDDLPRAAAELSRVLKPGARFLIVTADPATRAAWTEAHPRDALHFHSAEEFTNAFRAAGLEIEKTESFRIFISFSGRKLP